MSKSWTVRGRCRHGGAHADRITARYHAKTGDHAIHMVTWLAGRTTVLMTKKALLKFCHSILANIGETP